jgi:hypothetical protein
MHAFYENLPVTVVLEAVNELVLSICIDRFL